MGASTARVRQSFRGRTGIHTQQGGKSFGVIRAIEACVVKDTPSTKDVQNVFELLVPNRRGTVTEDGKSPGSLIAKSPPLPGVSLVDDDSDYKTRIDIVPFGRRMLIRAVLRGCLFAFAIMVIGSLLGAILFFAF